MQTKAQPAKLVDLDSDCNSSWINQFIKYHNIILGKICSKLKEVGQRHNE